MFACYRPVVLFYTPGQRLRSFMMYSTLCSVILNKPLTRMKMPSVDRKFCNSFLMNMIKLKVNGNFVVKILTYGDWKNTNSHTHKYNILIVIFLIYLHIRIFKKNICHQMRCWTCPISALIWNVQLTLGTRVHTQAQLDSGEWSLWLCSETSFITSLLLCTPHPAPPQPSLQ